VLNVLLFLLLLWFLIKYSVFNRKCVFSVRTITHKIFVFYCLLEKLSTESHRNDFKQKRCFCFFPHWLREKPYVHLTSTVAGHGRLGLRKCIPPVLSMSCDPYLFCTV